MRLLVVIGLVAVGLATTAGVRLIWRTAPMAVAQGQGGKKMAKPMDLGSYDYVQRVYNANMRLPAYKLPKTLADGTQTPIDDGLIQLTLVIDGGRVQKITIVTTNPTSTEYMQTFEGFEFGFNAVATWIRNYNESTRTHGPSKGIVKGMLADYNTTPENVLTVSLTRVSGEPKE